MFRRSSSILAVAAVALVALAGPVDAARGGKGGGKGDREATTSSIVIDQSGSIVHGQAVTFTVSTTETDRPFSSVKCIQDGVMVYSSTRGHFQDYYDYFGEPVHYLSSLSWPSGDADCTADLTSARHTAGMRTLVTTSFRVDG